MAVKNCFQDRSFFKKLVCNNMLKLPMDRIFTKHPKKNCMVKMSRF